MALLEEIAAGKAPESAVSARQIGLVGTLLVAMATAVGLLWWRFGETVYATSLMSAILACF